MNIFVTDKCPIKSAKNLDDKRVQKMAVESAQMLSTAIFWNGFPSLMNEHTPEIFEERKKMAYSLGIYAPYSPNHKCNLWVKKTKGNYLWLLNHFSALCEEYEKRTGYEHASKYLLHRLVMHMKYIPEGPLTPFVNYAKNKKQGIDFTKIKNAIEAYNLYLCLKWERSKPKWYGETK